jgi:tetratricopeptide (TPR) repeat protein
MKIYFKIFFILLITTLPFCTGTKKYYKAAERLEKQGLVNEAAEFYMESLRRKPTNTDAQIKLKQVGQKYVSALSTEFFRHYNLNEDEQALITFEKLKSFTEEAARLNVTLDYPKAYQDDYNKSVERYCEKKYHEGEKHFKSKQYALAIQRFDEIKKYKPEFRKMNFYYKEAYCEPLYEKAMLLMQEKRYEEALPLLQKISEKFPDYRRTPFALDVASQVQKKYLTMVNSTSGKEKALSVNMAREFRNRYSKSNNIEFVSTPLFDNLTIKGNENKDVLRALSKASETDYLYVFFLTDLKNSIPATKRTKSRAWLQITQIRNDSVFYSYIPVDYFQVSAEKSISVTINEILYRTSDMAAVSENIQSFTVRDAIEYNELPANVSQKNIQNLFPVNPSLTPIQMHTVRSWRKQFEARNTLRPDSELENELINNVVQHSSKNFSQSFR